MLELGGSAMLHPMTIRLNKCFIKEIYIGNCGPINLPAHPHKLLTNTIIIRLTNTFDSYQPLEQAEILKFT